MFSETAYKNADACRFCWMCRHLCPIALKTGKEVNSARAKGLIVSMIKRGESYDESMAATMWECCLCGACTNDCATGYEPRSYIREARSIAIAEGIAPAAVTELADMLLETGNIYGLENLGVSMRQDTEELPENAKTLLYIGEVARAECPEIARSAINLLKKAGVNFTVLKDEPVSGGYMGDMLGFVDEVREKAVVLSHAVNASGSEFVIVLDPIDARIMKHEYAEWNCHINVPVLTMTSYLAELISEGRLGPARIDDSCSIHDAGALSRDLGETAPVRTIVAAMGLELREMFRNRDLAKSCGGVLLKRYAPKLSSMTVQGRWEDHLRTGAHILLTEAPGSFAALSSEVPEGCTISDITMLLDKACS